jgi:acyl-CoA thioester hydrolase
MEGLVGLGSALGMPDAFASDAESTLLVRDQHIRFMKGATPSSPLHMQAGILELSDTEARCLQLLVHSATGELAASFQTVIAHVTVGDLRPFPWSKRTRSRAGGLMVEVPARAAPTSLGARLSTTAGSMEQAETMGLVRISSGAIGGQECDVFGRMRPEIMIGRISDATAALATGLRAPEVGVGALRPPVHRAVLEWRITHVAWPQAGSRFEIRSGLAHVDERTERFVHWILDPETGQPWGTAITVTATLDSETGAILPISQESRLALDEQVIRGLAF